MASHPENCNSDKSKSMDRTNGSPFLSVVNRLNSMTNSVESLRRNAIALNNQKHDLLVELQNILEERRQPGYTEDEMYEIYTMAERLICRCLTVDISLTIPRTDLQEQAVTKINHKLDKLEKLCEEDPSQQNLCTIQSCLNACLPEPGEGSIDCRFQGEVLDCTVDDQKNTRKKLESLLEKLQDRVNGTQ